MILHSQHHTRDERGATAVLVGILAIVLFGIGAFAVDIGQAYAKRSLEQTSVDLAVMAAAAELENEAGCNDEVIQKATEFLKTKVENQVPGQYPIDLGGSFGDGDGYIQCPGDWKVRLEAPSSRVDLTLGRLISDEESIDVTAEATAQVKSPSQSSSLPMYAVAGCDNGYQQLTDPPPGPPPAATVPDLSPDGPPYNGVNSLDILSPNPAEVASGTIGTVPMTLGGKNLTGDTAEVWFTTAEGDHVAANGGAPLTATKTGTNFTINVPTIPQQVLDTDGIWYVRVFNDGKWSAESNAQPLVIGELLFCDGMVSGNFGTLKIARSDGNPSTWLERNIIHGIEPLMQINASSAVPCTPEDSTHSPETPTDCIGTDPGFPHEAATDGLVNGSGGDPGRLDHDTADGCDRNGGDSRTMSGPKPLNDDVLACFLTGGHSVGDVVAGTENVLSGDIFSSPRFFQIPVIPVQASNGSSTSYPIIDFRAGFITTEPLSSTRDARGSVTGHNGVTFHGHKVEQLDVLLFPDSALPETAPPMGGEIDYVGHGTKVLVLVD